VGPAAEVTILNDTRRLDARGQFLIPGLWDMHTHSIKLSPQFHHALYVAYGVTGVRDMSGCLIEDDAYWACPHDRKRWSDQVARGERVSPRYPLQSSYQTNGGNEVPDGMPTFFRLTEAADGKQMASFYRTQGVDFIKPYTELTPQQFQWLADGAAEQGLYLAGHKPMSVSLEAALMAGQRSIEHGRLFLLECFRDIDSFRGLPDPIATYDATLRRRLLEETDEAACAAHMRAMAQADAWWVPTLTTLRMPITATQADARADPRLDDVPWLRRVLLWNPDARRAAAEPPAAGGRSTHALLFDRASRHVAQAHQAGVRLMAGTDTPDTFVFPGSSLHDELQMLVDAGLSPAEALRTATVAAAEFAGARARHGTVGAGQAADLVLLEGNPLEDIANTRRITGVFLAGYRHDAQALQELRDFARTQATSIQANLNLLWDLLASPLMRRQLAD
jgi:imidazolonepropionase-like amidohydrolase